VKAQTTSPTLNTPSSASYGLHVEFAEDPVLLTVAGAHQPHAGHGGRQSRLRCRQQRPDVERLRAALKRHGNTPAPASIDAPAAVDVRIYGSCMANVTKGANVTFITGATRFEVDTDVR
jgi:hypothetical protein